jgi:hypothetical protein
VKLPPLDIVDDRKPNPEAVEAREWAEYALRTGAHMPGNKIIRTFQIARNETVEIRWTDPKTGQVLIERYDAPPAATWQARLSAQEKRDGREARQA